VTAEGEQARLVALYERLEGAVVATADQRDEPLVPLQSEQRRPASQRGQPRRMLKSRGFQGWVPAPGTP
jgi:hypothetical protein